MNVNGAEWAAFGEILREWGVAEFPDPAVLTKVRDVVRLELNRLEEQVDAAIIAKRDALKKVIAPFETDVAEAELLRQKRTT